MVQAVSSGRQIALGMDDRSFVRELLLSREAGYINWLGPSLPPNERQPDPLLDANGWLQQIRDVRLTLDGRDRARGRVVLRPLPDPAEDDDRAITGMTLEEIARAIGDTYSTGQMPRHLRDSGVPDRWVPEAVSGSKWEYVLSVLTELHDGGSSARRTLREFIGGSLEGRHHAPPENRVRRRIVALLGQQGCSL